MVSKRGYRVLSALFGGAGDLISRHADAKNRSYAAQQKSQRLQDLFSNVPELEGFQSAIDPATGEVDDIALEILRERGRSQRSEDQARNIADRMMSQSLLNDKLSRMREKEKRVAKLSDDPMKFEELLAGRGLPSSAVLAESGISSDELLNRIRSGKNLPRGRSFPKGDLWNQTLEFLPFVEPEMDYEIIDPGGEYDKMLLE